jgi:hypothetical protein
LDVTFLLLLSNIYKQMGGACRAYGDARGVKPEGKRLMGRPRRIWENTIIMDLQEFGCGSMDRIELA